MATRIVRLAVCLAFLSAVAVADNDNSNCTGANYVRGVTCPPPSGSLVFDFSHLAVCGRGQCMRDARGIWMCSAQPGGRAMRNMNGQVVCTGGCEPAAAELCETPR
jgi:hypothetical protein